MQQGYYKFIINTSYSDFRDRSIKWDIRHSKRSADAASPARASGIISISADIRFIVTKSLHENHPGKSGRKALSTSLETSIS